VLALACCPVAAITARAATPHRRNGAKFTHQGELTVKVTIYDEAQYCLKRYQEANSLPVRRGSGSPGGPGVASSGASTGLRASDDSTSSTATTPSSISRGVSGIISVGSTPGSALPAAGAPVAKAQQSFTPPSAAQLQPVCVADDCVRWEACMAQAQQRAASAGVPLMLVAPRFRPRSFFFFESPATRQHAAPHMHLLSTPTVEDGGDEQPVLAADEQLQALVVHVEIMDTGIGIPADKAALLFQKFKQVDASMTRRYGGTGLGLPICERLTAIQGGSIWVASSEGAGSSFTFTARLQVKPSAWRRHSARAAAVQQLRRALCTAGPQMSGCTVASPTHAAARAAESTLLASASTAHSQAFATPRTLSTPVLRALVDPSSTAASVASALRAAPPGIPAVVAVSKWPTDRLAIDMLLTGMGYVPLHVSTIAEAAAVYEALPSAEHQPIHVSTPAAAATTSAPQQKDASAAPCLPLNNGGLQNVLRFVVGGRPLHRAKHILVDLDAVIDEGTAMSSAASAGLSIVAANATSSGGDSSAVGASGAAVAASPATTAGSCVTTAASGDARVTHSGIPQAPLCLLQPQSILPVHRHGQAGSGPAAAPSQSDAPAAASPDLHSLLQAAIAAVHLLAQRHSVLLLAPSRLAVVTAGANPDWFSGVVPKPPRWRTLHEALRQSPAATSAKRLIGSSDDLGAGQSSAAAAGGSTDSGAAINFSTLRVLVVDDNNVNLKLGVKMLSKVGVKQVGTAVDGMEAVEKARDRPSWGESLPLLVSAAEACLHASVCHTPCPCSYALPLQMW